MKDVIAALVSSLSVRAARLIVVALLVLGLPYLYGMDKRISALDSKTDRQALTQENANRLLAARVEMSTQATQELVAEVRKLRELLAERALDRRRQ